MHPTAPARTLARVTAVLGPVLALTAATVLAGPAAQAQSVGTGTLAFSGDPGDWITGGRSYGYTAGAQDHFEIGADPEHRHVVLQVEAAGHVDWTLDLTAPAGQALTVGHFAEPAAEPSEGGADVSLHGDGRGCDSLGGSFTVSRLVFGPYGYVQAFDASFEQRCQGSSAALRGEVHIVNPPPPAGLVLGVRTAVRGGAGAEGGKAAVHGTVRCNKPATVTVSGEVVQSVNRVEVRGPYSTSVSCVPGAPVAWQAQAVPAGSVPFRPGRATVSARAEAADPDYEDAPAAVATGTATVRLAPTAG
ncbi:hypothetical protein GCM10018781_50420 [Kitasatospora indigofera]|uniref:Uncharacterized protein n=1 Tax=Kitasatospora indigofera TaxID=67307 RepID=A0A919G4A2_9ACTN|nr:hypothetical protein [Kitasatospora indigofera]GHH77268.1 hypothetical protein GCM10018781_50420 [Kitasatospora indigofera]